MATVAQHLDHNRRELLDLSTRNRLLSIPVTSKSARLIHIEDERSDQVFRILKVDEKLMSFLPGRNSTGGAEEDDGDNGSYSPPMVLPEDEEEGDENRVAKRHTDSRLQTALSPEGLQRRLLALYTDSRTIQEEQGVNVLFLALGQLKWREDATSEIDRFAPLVLLPVELVRSTASDKFKIRWTGQDIQENLCLSEKLKNEFQITLPEFGDDDGFDISTYFAAVAKCLNGRAWWGVVPDKVTLGFFSFSKLMMFLDLAPENWPEHNKIDANPLISGLLIDGFPCAELPFGDDSDLDEAIPVDRLDHVMDADGSQSVVVEIVRSGRNLVVQGPPGTGKSQTICNILAAAVLDGKRVLFVAEKMAALEVVKRRLESTGLGALCLELHSNKANKRAVLDDRAKTWNLGRPVAGAHEEAFSKLEKLRKELNQHCTVIHQMIQPSGLTPFRIIGALVKLRQCGVVLPSIQLDASDRWSTEETNDIRRNVNELVARVLVMGPPSVNPWRGSRLEVFLQIDGEPILTKIRALDDALSAYAEALKSLAQYLTESGPDTLGGCDRLLLLADHIAKAPNLDRAAISNSVWNAGLDELREIVAVGRRFALVSAATAGKVGADVWTKDLSTARAKFAAHGDSIFRILHKDYREAFAEFRGCLSAVPLPRGFAERLALFDSLVEGQTLFRRIASMEELGLSAFGWLWRRESSDWPQLEVVIGWVQGHTAAGLSAPFRKLYASVENTESSAVLAAEMRQKVAQFENAFGDVQKDVSLDLKAGFGVERLDDIHLSILKEQIAEWLSSIESLSEWVAYYSRSQHLRSLGLGPLVEEVENDRISPEYLASAFDWAYYSRLLREVVRQFPELGSFDGLIHESVVEEFRKVDCERLEFSKLRTLLKHYENMPPSGEGVGVTGVLKAEMARKRGHMPLRRLLAQAGHAIQAIKPVFMMSPLSVAQYLEPGAVDFDLLVIDEASQVEPVDALGAIARSKQVVVVGDSKQLPPSRFFMRMTTEASAEEFESEEIGAAAKDIESILGLCLARGFPQKMLRWHYRSRHHSLIAVSNHEFYDRSLFIVPSPYPTSNELGLRFNHLPDGVFDSGNTAVNRLEAKTVAEAVMAHATSHPKLTLGVAAFSIRQRDAIQDELELLRRGQPDTESFFNAHPHEPFFVKNLENVQGDERDVIFISIGYGRDASGFMAMRFGPLSSEGGERRMNVLISRAKQRCEIFSSITSDDIDLSRASGRGVATLKTFLHFAETGHVSIAQRSGKGEDSPFEEAVREELEKNGHTVDTQVGEAGFFIDLAVRNPEAPGAYVLGIECDGATYHSSRSARDRDRLRQAVLEDHGWFIHRIWSTDWFQRPDRELRRVLIAIEKAHEQAKTGVSGGANTSASSLSQRERTVPEIGRVTEKEPEAPIYRYASLEVPVHRQELHLLNPGQLVQYVQRVLAVEAPVSIDEIVLRIRSAWGYERAGSRIHELISKAARLAIAKTDYAVEEGFYVNRAKPAVPRRRDDSTLPSLRKPENLPPQEIRATVLVVVERHLGVQRGEVAGAVARLLGFKSTIDAQVRKLLQSGVVTETDQILRRTTTGNQGTPL